MQGPESDKRDVKLSFLLALCILFALIAAGLVSCENKPKYKPQPIAEYSEGQIVYLKPDSTIGVIGQVNVYMSSGVEYRIGYKNNEGVIEYHDFTETQIYGKK